MSTEKIRNDRILVLTFMMTQFDCRGGYVSSLLGFFAHETSGSFSFFLFHAVSPRNESVMDLVSFAAPNRWPNLVCRRGIIFRPRTAPIR